jgi:hypothetical protein
MPAPSDPGNSDGLIHILFAALDAVGGMLLAVLAYFLNLYRGKVDDMQEEHKQFTKSVAEKHGEFVTREELDRKFVLMLDEHRHNHEQNTNNFRDFREDLREDIRGVHTRIDEILNREPRR